LTKGSTLASIKLLIIVAAKESLVRRTGIYLCGFALLVLTVVSTGPSILPGAGGSAFAAGAQIAEAKSLILLIGDGMGPQILSIGKVYSEMELNAELNMVLLANRGALGYVTTHSADKLVTDSAASGTALACGKKTNNGMVGWLPDDTPIENICDIALRQGKSVGAVTTTSVTHATPACFLAHHKYRTYEWDIAEQIAEGDANVVLGGGTKYFLPPERGGGRRGGDLTVQAAERGFDVVFDRESMLASEAGRLLGLFSPESMPFELERDVEKVPSLTEMTAKAIEILSRDEDGFVLMVEGGRIDHAEHENNIARSIGDLIAFDAAVGYAMEFQEDNPDVIVIVTADHDCGGPAITASKGAYDGYPGIDQYHAIDDESPPFIGWVSGDHTATMVPIIAIGPGEEHFRGIIDNVDVNRHMVAILGLKE
jgi:alkaline phosphatase